MTVCGGIFLSEGTPEGRESAATGTPAGHATRSHEKLTPLKPLGAKFTLSDFSN